MKKEYHVVGGMAGSSMDGLDLVWVQFLEKDGNWEFEVKKSKTIEYPAMLFKKLHDAANDSDKFQHELDEEFGVWIGARIKEFLASKKVDLLAIHGHTVVHDPASARSWQLGSGASIAKVTRTTTVTRFRDEDVKLGGQGAPLVPFGDFHLFADYDACLNLGGIANISLKRNQQAGDICPCNQVLNYYASQLGLPFDRGGALAREGHLDQPFFERLMAIPYFRSDFPKSLANGFLTREVLDMVEPKTGLRTYVSFIAKQVASCLKRIEGVDKKLLVSGGGTFNTFLIEEIKQNLPKWNVILPSDTIVNFKEAIIFGFLGLKKQLEQVNVLSSVTGAPHDTSSGVIHLPE